MNKFNRLVLRLFSWFGGWIFTVSPGTLSLIILILIFEHYKGAKTRFSHMSLHSFDRTRDASFRERSSIQVEIMLFERHIR